MQQKLSGSLNPVVRHDWNIYPRERMGKTGFHLSSTSKLDGYIIINNQKGQLYKKKHLKNKPLI